MYADHETERQLRVDRIMEGMGFHSGECGPYVAELREVIFREVKRGLVSRSLGTWSRGDLTVEERAKALLALEWALEHGHSYRREVFDPIVSSYVDLKTGCRGVRMRWHRVSTWLGDRLHWLGMRYRVWRGRRLANPYL